MSYDHQTHPGEVLHARTFELWRAVKGVPSTQDGRLVPPDPDVDYFYGTMFYTDSAMGIAQDRVQTRGSAVDFDEHPLELDDFDILLTTHDYYELRDMAKLNANLVAGYHKWIVYIKSIKPVTENPDAVIGTDDEGDLLDRAKAYRNIVDRFHAKITGLRRQGLERGGVRASVQLRRLPENAPVP